MPALGSLATHTTPVSVMLPVRLLDALNARALESGLSRSAVICQLVDRGLFGDAHSPTQAGACEPNPPTTDLITETKED